jgi:glutamyl-tRNA synthetase
VRFAPSPTGYFHVGGARTALFNWLFARQQGGTFILRIEDTDTERNREEYTVGIERAMRWLGLEWDEGPFFQSQRSELYDAAVEELLAKSYAYACDCPPGAECNCRDRGLEPIPGRALRFRTPDEGTTTVVDVVRGRPEFPNENIADFVIRKSNGGAPFLLANVVDDADMRITHVIRGEDHLSNTPRYEMLWSALGYGDYPLFAHLPLLVNERREKLSKRRDKVALEDFRDEGYLPEAMRNYLALLGWSPGGDREIVPLNEIIAEFRLEDVKSSPAFFDEQKLQAFNAEYIRNLSADEFVERSAAWWRDRWAPLAPLVQERVRTLGDIPRMLDFLFRDEPVFDEKDWEKGVRKQPLFGSILDAAAEAYASCPWVAASIEDAARVLAEHLGVPKMAAAQAPIRLAVTGRAVGPPLWQSLEVLGRDKTIARLRAARVKLGETPSSN